ncbi:MAG: LemA family protein [Muribaculaceae bacterium]|nr:LemA family protein [Muribaculaceae bacterium]
MNKGNKILIGIGLFIVLLIAMGGCTYNGMMRANEEVNNAWSNVEAQYQRRANLIPNLVNTVKGYAAHEASVLEKVTYARAGMESAADAAKEAISNTSPDASSAQLADYVKAQQKLKDAMSIYINAVHEAYPDLKANENFSKLQDELAGTESRVTKARQDYNSVVKTYNVKVRRFPANLLAGILGFSPRHSFQAEAGAENAPKVEF